MPNYRPQSVYEKHGAVGNVPPEITSLENPYKSSNGVGPPFRWWSPVLCLEEHAVEMTCLKTSNIGGYWHPPTLKVTRDVICRIKSQGLMS